MKDTPASQDQAKLSLAVAVRSAVSPPIAQCMLVLTGLFFLSNEAHAQCMPQPAGLVSWWRAEGDAGDSIGPNHGARSGGLGFAAGQFGQAFNYVSGGQGVTTPPSTSLNVGVGPGFTFEGWINPTQTNSQLPIV